MKKFFNTDFILNYMKENHLSKTKFCKLCHIGMSTLNKLLHDDLSLRIKLLWKLAKGMNVDLRNLLYRENKA